jgi:hypothetical protein
MTARSVLDSAAIAWDTVSTGEALSTTRVGSPGWWRPIDSRVSRSKRTFNASGTWAAMTKSVAFAVITKCSGDRLIVGGQPTVDH